MPKVYYKVVDKNLRSAWIVDRRLTTQYEIGKFVSSPTPETPLAVFQTLEKAKDFKRNNILYSAKIFKCNIKNKTKEPWLPGTSGILFEYQKKNLNEIISLIKAKKKFTHLIYKKLPDGTITCKQVKLLEEIKQYE
jgi:hypothetical protein